MTDPRLITVGDAAPQFTAECSDGETRTLDGMLAHGPVVLVFYPGNNTPG